MRAPNQPAKALLLRTRVLSRPSARPRRVGPPGQQGPERRCRLIRSRRYEFRLGWRCRGGSATNSLLVRIELPERVRREGKKAIVGSLDLSPSKPVDALHASPDCAPSASCARPSRRAGGEERLNRLYRWKVCPRLPGPRRSASRKSEPRRTL
jgi:hypothetical protein